MRVREGEVEVEGGEGRKSVRVRKGGRGSEVEGEIG